MLPTLQSSSIMGYFIADFIKRKTGFPEKDVMPSSDFCEIF